MSDAPIYDPLECPRCAELRGRSVKMLTVKNGRRNIATAYDCPSCDYVIPLAVLPSAPLDTGAPVMSPEDYLKRLADLGFTQEQAGAYFDASPRTGQRWASEGPPVPVAMILYAVGKDRAKLDRLRRRCNIS